MQFPHHGVTVGDNEVNYVSIVGGFVDWSPTDTYLVRGQCILPSKISTERRNGKSNCGLLDTFKQWDGRIFQHTFPPKLHEALFPLPIPTSSSTNKRKRSFQTVLPSAKKQFTPTKYQDHLSRIRAILWIELKSFMKKGNFHFPTNFQSAMVGNIHSKMVDDYHCCSSAQHPNHSQDLLTKIKMNRSSLHELFQRYLSAKESKTLLTSCSITDFRSCSSDSSDDSASVSHVTSPTTPPSDLQWTPTSSSSSTVSSSSSSPSSVSSLVLSDDFINLRSRSPFHFLFNGSAPDSSLDDDEDSALLSSLFTSLLAAADISSYRTEAIVFLRRNLIEYHSTHSLLHSYNILCWIILSSLKRFRLYLHKFQSEGIWRSTFSRYIATCPLTNAISRLQQLAKCFDDLYNWYYLEPHLPVPIPPVTSSRNSDIDIAYICRVRLLYSHIRHDLPPHALVQLEENIDIQVRIILRLPLSLAFGRKAIELTPLPPALVKALPSRKPPRLTLNRSRLWQLPSLKICSRDLADHIIWRDSCTFSSHIIHSRGFQSSSFTPHWSDTVIPVHWHGSFSFSPVLSFPLLIPTSNPSSSSSSGRGTELRFCPPDLSSLHDVPNSIVTPTAIPQLQLPPPPPPGLPDDPDYVVIPDSIPELVYGTPFQGGQPNQIRHRCRSNTVRQHPELINVCWLAHLYHPELVNCFDEVRQRLPLPSAYLVSLNLPLSPCDEFVLEYIQRNATSDTTTFCPYPMLWQHLYNTPQTKLTDLNVDPSDIESALDTSLHDLLNLGLIIQSQDPILGSGYHLPSFTPQLTPEPLIRLPYIRVPLTPSPPPLTSMPNIEEDPDPLTSQYHLTHCEKLIVRSLQSSSPLSAADLADRLPLDQFGNVGLQETIDNLISIGFLCCSHSTSTSSDNTVSYHLPEFLTQSSLMAQSRTPPSQATTLILSDSDVVSVELVHDNLTEPLSSSDSGSSPPLAQTASIFSGVSDMTSLPHLHSTTSPGTLVDIDHIDHITEWLPSHPNLDWWWKYQFASRTPNSGFICHAFMYSESQCTSSTGNTPGQFCPICFSHYNIHPRDSPGDFNTHALITKIFYPRLISRFNSTMRDHYPSHIFSPESRSLIGFPPDPTFTFIPNCRDEDFPLFDLGAASSSDSPSPSLHRIQTAEGSGFIHDYGTIVLTQLNCTCSDGNDPTTFHAASCPRILQHISSSQLPDQTSLAPDLALPNHHDSSL